MNSSYLYVAVTVFSTVASQVLFKKGTAYLGSFGEAITTPMMLSKYLNLYIVLGLLFSVISIVSWLYALSKLPLSHAYPYMSLTFPLVLFFSFVIFGEQVSWLRWLGVMLIVFGLVIVGRDG